MQFMFMVFLNRPRGGGGGNVDVWRYMTEQHGMSAAIITGSSAFDAGCHT